MRPAHEIRADVERVAREIEENEHMGGLLRKQLAQLMKQARDHPELTIEEVRHIPEKTISRQTAYEMVKQANGS